MSGTNLKQDFMLMISAGRTILTRDGLAGHVDDLLVKKSLQNQGAVTAMPKGESVYSMNSELREEY